MKLKITKVLIPSNEEWDQIWKECDYATFFHSREWTEIWCDYSNGKIISSPELLVFNDNKRVLLPFSYKKSFKGLIKNYISSPAGTFGGWISLDNIQLSHSLLIEKYLKKQFKDLFFRRNPYNRNVSKYYLKRSIYDFTQVLNLENGFESIETSLLKKHSSTLRSVRKARQKGILIKQASSLEDWKAYFNIYKISLKRWGKNVSSIYNWNLFYNLFTLKSQNIKLWLALYNQEIIAGAICFYSKKHVVYWHGAANELFFKFRPVNLLMMEIIKHTSDNGYKWFDFNPSGGHIGVIRFKKSFGAEEMSCSIIKNISIKTKILSYLSKFKNSIGNIF